MSIVSADLREPHVNPTTLIIEAIIKNKARFPVNPGGSNG